MIQVSNLSKFYGEKRAISGLNFKLEKGEIVGLLGRNGAGKTTTIRILTGFLIPSSGGAYIDGKSIFDNPLEAKRNIGYLPESPPLYEDLTVHDYLQFVCEIKQVEKDKIPAEIQRVIQKTNLSDVAHKLISTLSLGFRKRVGIAQAISGNPSVVIMDEPISGLDPQQIMEMRKLITSLAGDHTVLISSHILTEMHRTCDKFLFLQEGQLKAQFTLEQLEGEMAKVAGFEITLSGRNATERSSFLMNILEEVKTKSPNTTYAMDSLSESSDESTFLIKWNSEEAKKIFKSQLLSALNKTAEQDSNAVSLETFRKQEVSLEQIFMERV